MSGKLILMIEDDEEMLALNELILEKEGYRVLSATGGVAGLEVLRNNRVDLILLDIMMEDMDGWEVLSRIKGDERFKSIPVIMLTARHYQEDEQETARYAEYFEGYIVKPFVVEDLIKEVKRVLSARS